MTVDRNVIVESLNSTLQNMNIKGDLIITEEVGDGNVHLNQIQIEGTTRVGGGSINSLMDYLYTFVGFTKYYTNQFEVKQSETLVLLYRRSCR